MSSSVVRVVSWVGGNIPRRFLALPCQVVFGVGHKRQGKPGQTVIIYCFGKKNLPCHPMGIKRKVLNDWNVSMDIHVKTPENKIFFFLHFLSCCNFREEHRVMPKLFSKKWWHLCFLQTVLFSEITDLALFASCCCLLIRSFVFKLLLLGSLWGSARLLVVLLAWRAILQSKGHRKTIDSNVCMQYCALWTVLYVQQVFKMGSTRRLRRLLCGQQNMYISVQGRRLRIYLKARNKKTIALNYCSLTLNFHWHKGNNT